VSALSSLSKSRKKFIILRFTHELIKNSGEYFYILEQIVKEKETRHGDAELKEEREKREKVEKFSELKPKPAKNTGGIQAESEYKEYEQSLKPLPTQREKFRPPLGIKKLFIPEPKLPQRFEYLKPIPMESELDLGKLNLLVKDPMVKIIECHGPEENITVTGTMGTKNTGIILNRDEINEIVGKFSKISKIPVHEGVFRVVVGRFIFSAIISEIIGSRFTIRKMIYNVPVRREV